MCMLIETTRPRAHTHTHYYTDPPTFTISVIQQRREGERGCVDLMCRTVLSTLPLIPRHAHKSAAKWSKKGPLHLDLWAFNQPMCHINFHLLNLHLFTGEFRVWECIWVYMEGQKVLTKQKNFSLRRSFWKYGKHLYECICIPGSTTAMRMQWG